MSRRERRDALRLVDYQTARGAAVALGAVAAPEDLARQMEPEHADCVGNCSAPMRALTASLDLQRCLTKVTTRQYPARHRLLMRNTWA